MKVEAASVLIAAYAAVISTFLGIREIWKSRPKFDVSSFSTGEHGQDDRITIYNDSHNNVIIKSYSIIKDGKNIFLGNEADFYLISIRPQEAYSIHIDEQYKFRWDGEIYIQFHIMGRRRSVRKKIN